MTDRRIAAALFLLAALGYIYIYGGWGANQEVNFALTRSIVEKQVLHIDEFTVRDGDIATGQGGRIYSNKAPGLSALGVLPYSILLQLQRRGVISFDDYWPANKRVITVIVCGLSGALIAPILYLHGRRRYGVSRFAATFAALAIAFGSIVFPYSTMLFAHVPSALFLLLALVLLKDRPLWAGVCAGVAGSCFYLSGIAAAVLVVMAWLDSRRKALFFLMGGLPFAAALAIYNWICFGSPLVTPVERSTGFTEKGLLFGVFRTPRLDALWGLTLSEYRGLLFCSPVLLLALAGVVIMFRSRQLPREVKAILVMAVFFLFTIASFNGWHGGAAFGPRYLIPMIPLLAIPLMFALSRFRAFSLALLAVSMAINLAATAVDPMTIDGLEHPLTAYIVPSLFRQPLPADTNHRAFPDCPAPPCTSRSVSLAQDATNFGEAVFGKGRSASIIPLAIWIFGGGAALLLIASRLDRGAPSSRAGDAPGVV